MFFQAEDGIRDLVRSRGLGDVYKRQAQVVDHRHDGERGCDVDQPCSEEPAIDPAEQLRVCLLYTSDAADERSSVDLGGRRIIKTKSCGLTRCPHDLTLQNNATATSLGHTPLVNYTAVQ